MLLRVKGHRPPQQPRLLHQGLQPGQDGHVEQVLKAIKGVRGVSVSPKDGEVFVEYDGQVVSPGELLRALSVAGFQARAGSP